MLTYRKTALALSASLASAADPQWVTDLKANTDFHLTTLEIVDGEEQKLADAYFATGWSQATGDKQFYYFSLEPTADFYKNGSDFDTSVQMEVCVHPIDPEGNPRNYQCVIAMWSPTTGDGAGAGKFTHKVVSGVQ